MQPTKFYETEEGRFCNLCFDPEIYKNNLRKEVQHYSSEKKRKMYVEYLWHEICSKSYSEPIYDQEKEHYKSSLRYEEFPNCECCNYEFKDVSLLTQDALYELGFCDCGNTDIVSTYFNINYIKRPENGRKYNRNICSVCNEKHAERQLYGQYQHLAFNERNRFLNQLEENKLDKQLILSVLYYMSRYNELNKEHGHYDDPSCHTDIIYLTYLLNKV